MRKYIRLIIMATVFSFIWGLWWGYKKIERQDPLLNARVHIKVLAPQGIFSEHYLHELLIGRRVHLDVETYNSPHAALQQLFSSQQKYDLVFVSSFLTESLSLDRHFLALTSRGKRIQNTISFDFLNLSFDPNNQFVIPILWGVNGFLVPIKTDADKFSLVETFKDSKSQSEAALLQDPTEIFSILRKLTPIVSTWVDTGQKDELKKNIRSFKSLLSHTHSGEDLNLELKGVNYFQMSNGRAADYLPEGKWSFILPKERSNLWLILAAVHKNSLQQKEAEIALEVMFEPKWIAELSRSSREANTLTSLNNEDKLNSMRKANYIRTLPMSRIELFSRHEVFEPTFMESLREELSLLK